jgi:nitric oxide reductase NorE protein
MRPQAEALMPPPPARAPGDHRPRVLGEPGVWVLILADLILFGVFFVVLSSYRTQHGAEFAASQEVLNRGIATANTVVLVTSGLLIAIAVRRARARRDATLPFRAGIVGGVVFVVLKLTEYALETGHGATFSSNVFFSLYYGYTSIHLLHVVFGVAALLMISPSLRAVGAGSGRAEDLANVESAASFWHLVDVLWIALYALVYLI